MHVRAFFQQLALLGLMVTVSFLLAACGRPPPTPTAAYVLTEDPEQQPTPAQGVSELPTQGSLSGVQPSATMTRTPLPPAMPDPEESPAPVVMPEIHELLDTAQREQFNGNYGAAIALYQRALENDPVPDVARQASYGLAESYLLDRQYVEAASVWSEFLTQFPDDARWPVANLMAARSYASANDCAKAIERYHAYLSRDSTLADLVYDWIGDCHALRGELDEALAAYRSALGYAQGAALEVALHEQIAGVSSALGDYEAAVGEYETALQMVTTDYYRARLEHQIGQVLMAAGRSQEAYVRYKRTVERYPRTDPAYLSLVELLAAGQEVDQFQRGLVDYYAGANYPDASGAAIRAFDSHLDRQPAERAEEALYYKALAQKNLGQSEPALETLEALIAGYPESDQLAHAWLAKAEILVAMGDTEAGIKAYRDLAAFFPAHELAPDALWRAAQLRESEGSFSQAADLYKELQASFPSYKNADDALWWAGLGLYEQGEPDRATAYWQSLVEKYPDSAYSPKCLYWLGKIAGEADSGQSSDFWDQLLVSEPFSYYALRVKQIRASEPLTVSRLITSPVEQPSWEVAQAGEAILTWLRGWTDVPTTTLELVAPGGVAEDAGLRRGETLLAAGLRREALATLDAVRAAAWEDPLSLAQLSVLFSDLGVAGLAARSAYRVAWLWPEGTIHEAPVELQRLAYPLVYADLLSSEAQVHGLDPLLLAALVRQESLFEPTAESYAGARGLGQVMPATGSGIATSLGVEDFGLEDLFRPSVSLRFGAYYLGAQLQRFDGQILIALAAYNGGPGNALRWLDAAGEDTDFFVEVITAEQSRLYLQRVYEQYAVYERLYRPGKGQAQ
jgi:soluble lytic murein transglycosylase